MAEQSIKGLLLKTFGAAASGAAGVGAGFYGAMYAASYLAANTALPLLAAGFLPVAGLVLVGALMARYSPNVYTKSFGLGLIGGAGYVGYEMVPGFETDRGSFAREVLGK